MEKFRQNLTVALPFQVPRQGPALARTFEMLHQGEATIAKGRVQADTYGGIKQDSLQHVVRRRKRQPRMKIKDKQRDSSSTRIRCTNAFPSARPAYRKLYPISGDSDQENASANSPKVSLMRNRSPMQIFMQARNYLFIGE